MKISAHILTVAGNLSFFAALIHIAIIFGGPDWYRFFGAGEAMAQMAEERKMYPVFVTLLIASVLTGWGLYALSGAGVIFRLPLLRTCLVLITAVYCIRGIYGFFIPVFVSNPYVDSLGIGFWVGTSAVCLGIGLLHLMGLKYHWHSMSNKKK